ncbi:MAG: UDP-N-acetylmuramoyl-L-alanine--D-glutamate ligase [Flavobacteriales bacterium]|nr:UDP-N-acetylmuramoyl-L-alanine--D-glutamate ligase [Bacteroidales bacterium AH-315-I05]PCJ89030.1 MAG: UDP-N-acetylmuramoyl-L-alanine--D-glutamate ligase [Flavobacteriales bacterium]
MGRVVVLGAGESGAGAAVLAKKKGFEVFVSDSGKIKKKYKKVLSHFEIDFEEEKHSDDLILNADEVIKSPGIPDKAEIVQKLRAKEIPVISEIEFAGRYTNAKMICITGSNGKTTTTSLTYHILKKAGINVRMAGNIGDSLAMQVAEEGDELKAYVLELSSFQLDGMCDFKADIAILLNITPDHLDRYDNEMRNYMNSKFRITQNQTEDNFFIYCVDDEIIRKEIETRNLKSKNIPFSIQQELDEGAFVKNEQLIININQSTDKSGDTKPFAMSIHELALQGRHNLYNTMAAGIVGRLFDLRKETIRECMSDFMGIEHRMEFAAKVYGIEFINDSKATNINSAWWALESMRKPVIWIAGGQDKGNDYSMLDEVVKQKVKAIVCLGKDNAKIIEAFDGKVETIVETTSAREAVAYAYRLGKKGDAVLLSPACASFDLFENYEDRGRQFKEAVRAL